METKRSKQKYSNSETGVTMCTNRLPPVKASDATLRDYFAANAMQGILEPGEEIKDPFVVIDDTLVSTKGDRIVADAYYIADAMIKARESTKQE